MDGETAHTVYLDGTKQEIQIQPRRQFGTLLQFNFEKADKLYVAKCNLG